MYSFVPSESDVRTGKAVAEIPLGYPVTCAVKVTEPLTPRSPGTVKVTLTSRPLMLSARPERGADFDAVVVLTVTLALWLALLAFATFGTQVLPELVTEQPLIVTEPEPEEVVGFVVPALLLPPKQPVAPKLNTPQAMTTFADLNRDLKSIQTSRSSVSGVEDVAKPAIIA